MNHDDFEIGMEFTTDDGARRWRVTDVGTRTIAAISLNVKDPSWLNGPSYAVQELIFDENDFPGCEPIA